MQAFLAVPDCAAFLAEELTRSGLAPQRCEFSDDIALCDDLPALGYLAFARQTLPNALEMRTASINNWAETVVERIAGVFPDDQPWRLHLWPMYGEGRAGLHRCDLIREAIAEKLKKRRRRLLKSLEGGDAGFTPTTSLVQLALSAPDTGFVSSSVAPEPHRHRALISAFPAGEVPVAEDKAAPSRAFAKVVEAELRLGRQIQRGETCVDLGAAPGSWTYVALQRGAKVIAVDRSPLRDDLMRDPNLRFHQADAFKFEPPAQVDWLICDVIAAPQRNIDLLLQWLRERRMRNFIVTIKFKGSDEYPLLDRLKRDAPPLCEDFRLNRLCANKNEVSAFGRAAGTEADGAKPPLLERTGNPVP